jgi:hypothetical protein
MARELFIHSRVGLSLWQSKRHHMIFEFYLGGMISMVFVAVIIMAMTTNRPKKDDVKGKKSAKRRTDDQIAASIAPLN